MFAANEKSKKDDITINYEPESGRLHDTLILVAGGTDSAMCPKHFERQQQLGEREPTIKLQFTTMQHYEISVSK